jgi:hypothetical protein
MSYRDGLPIRDRTPQHIIQDIRTHAENWRRFKDAADSWPLLSIVAYAVPYVAFISSLGAMVFYGRRLHGPGRSLGWWPLILIGFVLIWRRFVERAAWNCELRQRGISSTHEVWDVTQFPQDPKARE